MDTAQVTCGPVDCQKDHAGIRKHGGGMKKLLKQYGKRRKSMEIGKKKNQQRHGRSTRRVNDTQKGYLLRK